MKKSLVVLTLATSLGLAACSNPSEEVVVSTSIGDITQGEFYEEIKELAGPSLLEQVVMNKILNEKYEATDEEVQKQFDTYKEQYAENFESVLAMNGFTEKTFKDSIRFQILQQKAAEDVEVTDEEINKYYEQGKYELRVRHILVETAEEARALYEKIKAGEDFAKLAKENSIDPGSAENGGELDWFTVGTMVTEFNDTAYDLEVNEVSEPVQSQHGFHIIQLLEKREVADYASLEDQKDKIKDTIKAQKAGSTDWATVEARLLKEVKIDIKDEDLKNAFSSNEAEGEKEKE